MNLFKRVWEKWYLFYWCVVARFRGEVFGDWTLAEDLKYYINKRIKELQDN